MASLHHRILSARRAQYAWFAAGLLAITMAVSLVLGFAEGQDEQTTSETTPPNLPTEPPPALWEGVIAQGPLGDPTELTGIVGPGPGEIYLTWSSAIYSTAQWIYVVKSGEPDGRYWPESASGNPRGRYPAGSLAFTISELGQEYWFVVVAVQEQADGGPMLMSDWSNWASLTVPAASPPAEPVFGSEDPNGVLEYPFGLTASSGTVWGEVVLRWTPGSQYNIHWIYLSEADGSGGRYWPEPWTGPGVSEAELIVSGLRNGQDYRFSVVGGHVSPHDGSSSSSWSYWSPWAYATPSGTLTPGPFEVWGPPPPPPGPLGNPSELNPEHVELTSQAVRCAYNQLTDGITRANKARFRSFITALVHGAVNKTQSTHELTLFVLHICNPTLPDQIVLEMLTGIQFIEIY